MSGARTRRAAVAGAEACPTGQIAALAGAVAATSMTFIDAAAVNQALPAIGGALGASPAQLLWVVGACAVALAALLLPAGLAADRWGRRGVLGLGIVVFAVGSGACAAAPGVGWLIAGRAAQGIGGALMVPASLAVLIGAHGLEQRGRAIGAWSAWCAAAMVAGPLIGGALAEAGLWRAVFLVNLPLGLAALACLRLVPAVEGERRGRLAPRSLVPPAVWRVAGVRAAACLTLVVHTALHGLLLVLPLALIAGAGYRADSAAAAQLPMLLLLIGACPLAGRWADRRGPRGPVCAGCVAAGLAAVMLVAGGFGPGPEEYAVRLLGPLALLGAGVGLAIVPLSATVIGSAGERALGAGAAVNALLARVAAAAGVALFGGLLLARGVEISGAGEIGAGLWDAAFRWAAGAAALMCAGSAVIAARHLPAAGADTALGPTAQAVEARP